MNVVEIIFAAILGGLFGYSVAVANDECPAQILGYNCKGDMCNHSKYKVRKAKESMQQPPPPYGRFRP